MQLRGRYENLFIFLKQKIEYRRLFIKRKELISAKYREKHIQRSLKSLFYNFDRCKLYVYEIVIKFGACNFAISRLLKTHIQLEIHIIKFKLYVLKCLKPIWRKKKCNSKITARRFKYKYTLSEGFDNNLICQMFKRWRLVSTHTSSQRYIFFS